MRTDISQADPTHELDSNGPEKISPTIEVNATLDAGSISLPGNGTGQGEGTEDEEMPDADFSDKMESVKQRFMELTQEYGMPQLEILYTKVIRGLISARGREAMQNSRQFVVRYLFSFVEEADNF
jgi:hypothetical protein